MLHFNPLRRARRGVASMLAMLYLVLFSVLAVGFYATTTVSSQLSRNEQRVVEAELAADVGLDFMRFALYQVIIPSSAPAANLLTLVHGDLAELLEETGNLGTHTVSLSGSTIQVPAGSSNYIEAGGAHRFRAEITAPWAGNSADPKAKTLRVRVTGLAGTNRKVLEVEFDRDERPTEFFKIGMVSKGQVNILTKNIVQGFPADQARVISLSTVNPPVTIGTASGTPGGIAGDIYVPAGTTPNVYPLWSVGGTTDPVAINANHIKKIPLADLPPVPEVNTFQYKKFVQNTFVAGQPSYTNIRIPANTNPIINGPTDIKGVVYIEQPNKVTFAGQCTITGVIVTEDKGVGTLLTNQLIFSGSGGAKAGVASLPDLPEFQGLKMLEGSFIVAPGFDVQLTGAFGTISGHIAGDKVTISGSSSSNITGSIIALKSTMTIGGNTAATLYYDANQGHAGLRVEDRYIPVMATYKELH